MEVRSIEAVVKALNGSKVQYLIVGGLAVNAHGYGRATVDVDLVIGLERDNILRGLRALESIDYHMSIPVTPEDFADEKKRAVWRSQKNMMVVKLWSETHRRTPVDVFVHEPFDFALEYSLARHEQIAGADTAPVVRLEALLAMKRAAGRPQDLADIADLERLQQLKSELPNDPGGI